MCARFPNIGREPDSWIPHMGETEVEDRAILAIGIEGLKGKEMVDEVAASQGVCNAVYVVLLIDGW